jgi:hypothetical protein
MEPIRSTTPLHRRGQSRFWPSYGFSWAASFYATATTERSMCCDGAPDVPVPAMPQDADVISYKIVSAKAVLAADLGSSQRSR